MHTYFAPAQRVSHQLLETEIDTVSRHPVMSGLLSMVNGLVAILNEQRQVVACNDAFMEMVGVVDPRKALGLRPGELLHCIHADKSPGGCGTSEWCSSCGAVRAILSSLQNNQPVEQIAAITISQGDTQMDFALRVHSQPTVINSRRFAVVFIQDITVQEQRAALERVFFHDINNLLTGMELSSKVLMETSSPELARELHQVSMRLINEVAIQRAISGSDSSTFQPTWAQTTSKRILEEVLPLIKNHPSAAGKTVQCRKHCPDAAIKTDISVLSRVLVNMLLNACEATDENGLVTMWVERQSGSVDFCVWNAQHIPPEIARRIFQRNFSTKRQEGRGFGTFSIKHFGENVLGGNVSFETSEEKGTTFRVCLPGMEQQC